MEDDLACLLGEACLVVGLWVGGLAHYPGLAQCSGLVHYSGLAPSLPSLVHVVLGHHPFVAVLQMEELGQELGHGLAFLKTID